jgi:hypothetical protein
MGTYLVQIKFIGNYTGMGDTNFVIAQGRDVWTLGAILGVAGAGLALLAGTLAGLGMFFKARRKKFGMKRRVSSFLDNLDARA